MKQNIDLFQNYNYRSNKRMNALADFDNTKRKMVRLFCKIYFGNNNCWSRCQYISGYMREDICVKDKYYFHLRDIYTALLYDIPFERLMHRYNYYNRQTAKKKQGISLKTFISQF